MNEASTVKICTKCGRRKKLSEFYRTDLRYRPDCKTCVKARAADYRKKFPAKVAATKKTAYERNRAYYAIKKAVYYQENKSDLDRYHRQWRKRNTTRLHTRLVKYRIANPDKDKARQMVARALKTGRLQKSLRCTVCNRYSKLHAHHDDYAKPLDVRWLCVICHKALHKEQT